MKILVISDTHGDTLIKEKVYQLYKDFDLFIHCGDYQILDYMMTPFLYVKGNCDYSLEAPLEQDIKTPIGKIHVEHGSSYLFINDPLEYIKSKNAKIFLVGHTHIPFVTRIFGTYLFNPGSLTRPRSTNFGTFLLIFIDEKTKEITYQFKAINLKTLDVSDYDIKEFK